MTPEQLTALKAAVLASQDAAIQAAASSRNDTELARLLNLPSAKWIWRSAVGAEETGNAWVGTDIDGMSALNMQRLQLLLASAPSGVFDMTRADRRAGFENPFGTNVNNASRAAMRAVWKRQASVAESAFAVGTGSETVPAISSFEGSVTPDDIGSMWNA